MKSPKEYVSPCEDGQITKKPSPHVADSLLWYKVEPVESANPFCRHLLSMANAVSCLTPHFCFKLHKK